jgi:epoxyqueuosine reductase
MCPNRYQLAAETKQRARMLGFDLVGIAPAEPSRHSDYFRQWLDDGRGGTMRYLRERFEERVEPAKYFPGVRSAICVALNYHVPLEPVAPHGEQVAARIARYALGDDYHELMKPRLYALADWLRERAPGTRTRCGVDTAPIAERELAARCGIGWVGKNTCVINEQIGSWILLGEVLTTLDLPCDDPAPDRCGTCTRCIDACPTGAITEPYQLDASRCIAYLNIEHEGPIPNEFHDPIGPWLFGCDVCQDVCPWNRDAPASSGTALAPRFPSGSVDVRQVRDWTLDRFYQTLRRSPVRRVKLHVLQRNARIVQANLQRALERQA